MAGQGSGGQPKRRLLVVVCAIVVGTAVAAGVVFGLDSGNATMRPAVQADQPTPVEGDLDLSSADATLVGAGTNDTAGWSTASGDVNGDGVDDLVVGAPRNDSADSNAGAVYLFYGPTDPGTVSLAEADAKLVGESAGEWAGWAVATGDLDGDGADEVVVGAPRAGVAGSNAGATYVLNGSTVGYGMASLADANATLAGSFPGDHAGWSVDVMTNVTANGTAGVLVGAPYANTSAPDAGAAYVVATPSLSGTVNLTNATASFYGTGDEDLAGWAVASAGDANGDGVDDVLVGAPRNDTVGNDSGAAYLVYGQRFGVSILDSANLTLVGAGEGDRAGYSLDGSTDVNGDDVPDLVVGAPLNDSAGSDAGAAAVVYGSAELSGTASLADADRLLVGANEGDRAGWSVAAIPDWLSCDGVGDVLVGAPYNDSTATNAGAAYVVAGSESANGWQSLEDAAATLAGTESGDRAGHQVASADASADGVGDVLVSAPYSDAGGTNAGAVHLAFGTCPEPTPTPTKTPTRTATPTKTPTKTATPTTAPADVVVTFLDCDAVEVTGEYSAIRLVVVGGPPQVFDADEGPTFYSEDGETIAVVQVLDAEGNLIVVAPRPGGVGDCVRVGGSGDADDDRDDDRRGDNGDDLDDDRDGDDRDDDREDEEEGDGDDWEDEDDDDDGDDDDGRDD